MEAVFAEGRSEITAELKNGLDDAVANNIPLFTCGFFSELEDMMTKPFPHCFRWEGFCVSPKLN